MAERLIGGLEGRNNKIYILTSTTVVGGVRRHGYPHLILAIYFCHQTKKNSHVMCTQNFRFCTQERCDLMDRQRVGVGLQKGGLVFISLSNSSLFSHLISQTHRPLHHISSFPTRDSTPRHEDCRQDCRKGSREETILLIRVLPSKDFTGKRRTHVLFSVVKERQRST